MLLSSGSGVLGGRLVVGFWERLLDDVESGLGLVDEKLLSTAGVVVSGLDEPF
jgi:hypothetical protein